MHPMLARLNELSKETKQKLGLAAFIIIALLATAYYLGVKPLQSKVAALSVTNAELEGKIGAAYRTTKKGRRVQMEMPALAEKLKNISSTQLPPLAAPLSWASSRLNAAARQSGVTLDRVEGVKSRGNIGDDSAFKSYGVVVTLGASYMDLIYFLEELERSNPYLTVRSLSIRARLSTPEVQTLNLVFEWPMWVDSKNFDRLSL